jgi:hypothetical protein
VQRCLAGSGEIGKRRERHPQTTGLALSATPSPIGGCDWYGVISDAKQWVPVWSACGIFESMKNSLKSDRTAKNGQYVLTSGRGAKISAVEGMKLSSRMGHILEQSSRHGLSGDERRKLIKEQPRKK